jgi:ABC-type transport system involved in multi-copper enzyme maturation permease subunit
MLASFSGSVIGFSTVGGLLGIIAYCVFAAQTAQEYTYGTLRNLLVRQPGRVRLLAGKLISMKLFAIVMVLISGVLAVAISYFLAPNADVKTDLWFTSDGRIEILQAIVNVSISVIGFGIFGMIMGLLLRSPISSIAIGVLWILIIENLIGAVRSSTLEWLPGSQLQVIAVGGTPQVSYTHAMALAGIYIAVGGLIASVLFSKRDVAN